MDLRPRAFNHTLYMNIGIPNSGKSTFSNSLTCAAFEDLRISLDDNANCLKILSTDMLIEEIATLCNVTYNEAFQDLVKFSEKMMYKKLAKCIVQKDTIVWDQTNVSKKIRKTKLSYIPSDYRRVALYFPIDMNKALHRNVKRFEKVLPEKILIDMNKKLEAPTYDEGFDDIFVIRQNCNAINGYNVSRETEKVV